MKKHLSISSASRTDPGKVRKHNEDACVTRDDIGVWIVADGMGGHHAGEVASGMIVDRIRDLEAQPDMATLADVVEDTLEKVNTDLMDMAREKATTIGSTVVGMLSMGGTHALVMWAGDSRIYRYRGKKLEMITQDHAMSEDLVESGVLDAEEAARHPQAERVTRAVGGTDEFYLDAELFELKLGDTYILCSDGLYKELTTEDILEITKKNKDRSELADELVNAALGKRARDNVTVVSLEVVKA